MEKKYDFKKDWPRIKGELLRLSKEAVTLAKKGEKEVRRYSLKGKLHLDLTALKLKQEHLYRMIGKEYIKAKCPAEPNQQIKKLAAEWDQIDKEMKGLSKKIKSASHGPAQES